MVGDVLTNRSDDEEAKSISSKSMAMTFTKAAPDGKIKNFYFHFTLKVLLFYLN